MTTTEESAQQRKLHDNGPPERTTKYLVHDKGSGRCRASPFAVRFPLPCTIWHFPLFFLSILFHLILIFIYLISFNF
jgi:hypothetical protein